MEIKAVLTIPYTQSQYNDFIVQYNHVLDYEIRRTENEIQAWGYTQEEIEEKEKENKAQFINEKIKILQEMSLKDILHNNIENIKIYNDVISGLEETKNNL